MKKTFSFVGYFEMGKSIVNWLDPTFAKDFSPRWSPDGNQIAFIRTPAEDGSADSLTWFINEPWPNDVVTEIDFLKKTKATPKLAIDLKNWKYFSHDWYLYFFARLNNFKVFIDHNSYILYRIHQSNVHGQLNLNNFNALKKRIQLIKSGWYYNHTYNFKQLLFHHSDLLFIYDMYNKNIFYS